MSTCSKEDLHLCGDPPFSLSFSWSDTCKEGSLSVYLAIFIFAVVFTVRHVLHYFKDVKAGGTRNLGIVSHHAMLANAGRWTKVTRWLSKTLEEIFVKPFIPPSVGWFIFLYFGSWFLITIPMALTRIREKRWAFKMLTLHGLPNSLSSLFGCASVDLTSINYTDALDGPHQEDELQQDYFKEVDFLFTCHLTLATLWLLIGCVQILLSQPFWSTDVNFRRRWHRPFGQWVALPSLCGHIFMAITMALKNPVKQHWSIQIMYLSFIVQALERTYKGVGYAIKAKVAREDGNEKKSKEFTKRHKVKMVTNYIWTTFGSGAIRLASWILWCIGKFFPFETRIKLDRGECQTYAKELGSEFVGQADQCLPSVFHNLFLTLLLLNWVEWIFFCVLEQDGEAHPADKKEVKVRVQNYAMVLVIHVTLLILFPGSHDVVVLFAIFLSAIAGTPYFSQFIASIIKESSSTEPSDNDIQILANDNKIRKYLVLVYGEYDADVGTGMLSRADKTD
mmetsp:Transcript_16141/g.34892  ORF Transcript_16141/g.34892 Transcript_16141/m.34892 type:complete len:506 (-) Transcript_16141:436-1953(-)|eukprot:CAMPEP_0172297034 /NCGR_PEP_ID=MMETSP1058-20130122/205_1 /TAXON_ID=83371 /ORGANISM="Detonula confervacea, Strain CCMP 353" /LENGTH=505 /DNA_ID=CAMNT_0013006133 /DNA_START=92 /DNA_END=1609 /DNA_ORIENTATION=+